MILLDTHVLLWWRADPRRLSRVAAREINRADAVLVSPIACWEVATLEAKGRIQLDRPVAAWVRDLYAEDGIRVAALTPGAAVCAAQLGNGFPGDPADRLLYATAADLRTAFVTKDERLRDWGTDRSEVKLVW